MLRGSTGARFLVCFKTPHHLLTDPLHAHMDLRAHWRGQLGPTQLAWVGAAPFMMRTPARPPVPIPVKGSRRRPRPLLPWHQSWHLHRRLPFTRHGPTHVGAFSPYPNSARDTANVSRAEQVRNVTGCFLCVCGRFDSWDDERGKGSRGSPQEGEAQRGASRFLRAFLRADLICVARLTRERG